MEKFPAFDGCLSELSQFILDLVQAYQAGEIPSWQDLERRVKIYFTQAKMEQMESLVPGWQRMASYSDGITLVHVMCVFLGLLMLPEFGKLAPEQKQLAKWIVLFHDIDKVHLRGQRDTMHAFRSAVQAANVLPRFGFPTAPNYEVILPPWSAFTVEAFMVRAEHSDPTPDNEKLPQILKGIDYLYGKNTPASLIVKTVLLHISLDVDPFYVTPAPLTDEEIRRYIGPELLPLLRAMMLADNEGWSIFDVEVRARQRRDTLQAFERIAEMITGP